VEGRAGDDVSIVKDYDLDVANTITFATGLDIGSVVQVLVL